MNKVLVRIYVPMLEEQYDMWIPLNKRIYNLIVLLTKGINELQDGEYTPKRIPMLYNKETGISYELNDIVMDTDIINGSELILI